ncbi:MAG: efflux RND transporter periplasmic adaptor subunit [Rhodospirillaceae bacterium]
MKHKPIAVSLIIAGGIAAFSVWRTPVPPTLAATDAAKAVAVVPALRHDLSRAIKFSAELRPYEEVDLHAKVAGYLKTISVDIGDRVKEGQVLARLDIEELREDLQHSDAAFRDASLNYDRIQEVVKGHPGLLAQEDVDKAETVYAMAKANREHAATMLGYATITAPFSGVVTKRYVDPGALIQTGANSSSQAMPLVHIANDTTLRLDFPVPESVVPLVKVGAPVDIAIEATGQSARSKVTRLAGKLDISTRTMMAEVDLDNHDGRITPGMYAAVSLVVEHKDGVVTLPIEAVSAGAKPTVWVVNAKGELEERPVVVGMRTDDQAEIVSGIAEGEKAVFGSRNALTLGARVTPKSVTMPVDAHG